MKKRVLLLLVLLSVIGAVYAQIPVVNIIPQLDAAVKTTAADIHRKLSSESAAGVSVGRFSYRNSLPHLSAYLSNQMIEELTNIPNRQYAILSEPAGAEWIISGEIVEIGATVRLYSRLLRSGDRNVAASFHSDLERNQTLVEMLSGGGRGSGSSSVAMDSRETDSFEYPIAVEPGADENSPVMNRSIHEEGDEDYFLIVPEGAGRLVAETTGSIDTVMELYDVQSGDELASDDDGASGGNARIRYNVEAGRSYIVKVRGYSGSTTGQYGFRAYLSAALSIAPDEYESDNDSSSAKPIVIGTPQRHTFHHGDDVDWVKFEVTQRGRYVITARGVSSTDLDTYIELFNEDVRAIDSDDDGGEGYDSRLLVRLETGLYYLKAECLDSEPEEPYTVTVRAEWDPRA